MFLVFTRMPGESYVRGQPFLLEKWIKISPFICVNNVTSKCLLVFLTSGLLYIKIQVSASLKPPHLRPGFSVVL